MSYVLDRFLAYCSVASQSDPKNASQVPSNPDQFDMANLVAEDLRALGAQNVTVDEHAYVVAHWPATPGLEDLPCLGFCAHIDTAWQANGKPVHPRVVRYEGGRLDIGTDPAGHEVYISEETNKHLANMVGWDLVVTDGTSLLGGDDKSAIAMCVALLKRLKDDPSLPHPRLTMSFVPDEEIAHGASLLDLETFGATWGYTIDGGPLGEFCYETFNACEVRLKAHGRSVHTGTAKGLMINAAEALMRYNELLPAQDRPEFTERYDGFFYLEEIHGDCVSAEAGYIIRDHDSKKFEARKELMRDAVDYLNKRYGEKVVEIEFIEQYRNLADIVTLPENKHLIDNAREAFASIGKEMTCIPMRGGTDGAQLSFRGLPCPNLSACYYNAHGYMEFVPVPELEAMVDMLVKLVELYAKPQA